jgi:hypothetical protein
MIDEWIPVTGEMINVGVPEIQLTPHEFIAITSDKNYLVWTIDKTRANAVEPKWCHKIFHIKKVFICPICRTTKNGDDYNIPRCHRRQMIEYNQNDNCGQGSLDHIHW